MSNHFVPDVYISKITLEEWQTDGLDAPLDTDPHIVSQDYAQPQLGIVSDDAKDMRVTVDLLFKEQLEGDDPSLFAIEQIVNAMKVAIYVSLSQEVTNKIMMASAGSFIGGSNTFIPQNVGKYLAKDTTGLPGTAIDPNGDLFKYISQGILKRQEVSLKEISQFNGIYGALGTSEKAVSGQFLANLDKEVMGDGSVLYKIPYSVPSFVISKQFGGTQLQHLTVFAVSYVSYTELLNGQTTSQFTNTKLDQIQEIKNNNLDSVLDLDNVQDSFITFIKNIGTGLASKNNVISNGSIVYSNTKFVYRGTEPIFASLKGKEWSGPVHYHGPNNPSPDGYQGYMGGTVAHMGDADPYTPTPKLLEVTVDSFGEILDLRKKALLDQQFFNYADFGFDNNFKDFFSPNLGADPKPNDPLTLLEKQTLHNDWLKAKQDVYISDPVFSLREDGTSNFIFSIDMGKTIRYNTSLPGLLKTIQETKPSVFNTMIQNVTIQQIKIYRQEVSKAKDDKGNHYLIEDYQMPVTIAIGSTQGGLLSLQSLQKPGFNNPAFANNMTQYDMGSIMEVSVLPTPGPNQIRTFAVADNDIASENNERKYFQYGLEMFIEDPVVPYLNGKLSILKSVVIELKFYYAFATSNPSFFNTYTNTFTKEFLDSFAGDPKSPDLSQFLDTVLFELKSFTSEQKNDLKNYIDSLIHPLYGNPNGVQTVLSSLESYEKNLLDLINSVSSTKGVKAKTYAEDTLSAKIETKGGKEAKNLIQVNKLFKEVFDTNSDGENGYEYVFGANGAFTWVPGSNVSSSPLNNYVGSSMPLSVISAEKFEERIGFEKDRYSIPDSFTQLKPSLNSANVQKYAPSYLGPLTVKINNNKKKIFDSDNKDVEILLDLLEIKEENKVVSDGAGLPQNANEIILTGNSSYPTLKNKYPSFLNILNDIDVSIEKGGSNTFFSSKEIKESSGELSQEQIDEGLKNNLLEYYISSELPEDPSELLMTLSIENKTEFVKKYNYENLLYSSLAPLLEDDLKKLPNHIKKIFSDVALAEQNGSEQEFKKSFENTINAAGTILNQGNLVKVEYLNFFKDGKIKEADFKILTLTNYSSIKNSASEGQVMLVRLRRYDELAEFKLSKDLELPIFNSCFLVQF